MLNSLVPYWIVKRDLSRLPSEQLSRAWPHASFLAAVLAFGPLSLPVHFTKTRRSLLGFGLGLGAALISVVVPSLLVVGLSALFGVEQ